MMGTFKTMHMLASSANHTNVFFDCIGGDGALATAVSILRLSKIYMGLTVLAAIRPIVGDWPPNSPPRLTI